MPQLLAIFVGKPKSYGTEGAENPFDRKWRTAFYKQPVLGKVHLGKLGLEGDGVADTRFHGGEHQAVLAYSADRYPRWRNEFDHPHFSPCCFGENFSVSGQDEDTVCVGDTYQIGEAIVQVSQPRQPCSNLAKRNRHKPLVEEVLQTGWSGWYLRVLQEGAVAPGDEINFLERPYPQWPVALVGKIRNFRKEHLDQARELAKCEALSPEWRGLLSK